MPTLLERCRPLSNNVNNWIGCGHSISRAFGSGSGVPMGAAVGGPKAADVLARGNRGTTFSGNPLAAPEGARPCLRDLPKAELRLVDSGHFAMEDQGDEIARLMHDFLARKLKAR